MVANAQMEVNLAKKTIFTTPQIGERSIVCLSVYLCVSVRDRIFGTTGPIFTNFCACYVVGPPLAV